MSIEIKYEQAKEKRKAFVKAVSDCVGITAVYLGAPTFNYKIGDYTVNKEGNLIIPDTADEQEIAMLTALLEEKGYTALNGIETTEYAEFEDKTPLETNEIGRVISIPANEVCEDAYTEKLLDNLKAIIESRKKLFQKSMGTDKELDVYINENDFLCFDCFERVIEPQKMKIYSDFLDALCKFANSAKRINKTITNIENEKFAMRTFLNRIGMSGKKYKEHRKELMKNLSGNSAFRYGRPTAENEP